MSAYGSIYQHTSAYVSIRQHVYYILHIIFAYINKDTHTHTHTHTHAHTHQHPTHTCTVYEEYEEPSVYEERCFSESTTKLGTIPVANPHLHVTNSPQNMPTANQQVSPLEEAVRDPSLHATNSALPPPREPEFARASESALPRNVDDPEVPGSELRE